jgi:Fe-S-cluster containining protein
MKGGPTLHEDDATLFVKGVLEKIHVYTLRKGEVIRNIDDSLMILEGEMIKIKGEGETWSCILFDVNEKACKIYQDRPAECRALKSWDPLDLIEVMAMPRLQRTNLINQDDEILKVIEAHEQRCAYETLEAAVKGLQKPCSDKAVEKILELLQYDHYVRPFLTEKLDLDPNAMDFLFGRPLATTIRRFGLCVKEEGEGFTLVPAQP